MVEIKKMSSNLDNYVDNQMQGERRGIVLPLSPVERDLERAASHAYLDVHESLQQMDRTRRAKDFPLAIYYAKKDGDAINLSVRVRTARNKDLYVGPYMPVFKAADFAKRLFRFFEKNQYGCQRTSEIVEE